jgi:hypothetical protein
MVDKWDWVELEYKYASRAATAPKLSRFLEATAKPGVEMMGTEHESCKLWSKKVYRYGQYWVDNLASKMDK